MFSKFIVSASAIALAATLAAPSAFANHKGTPHGGGGNGGGGGDATYDITLTDSGIEVAGGSGVQGSGGTIDGITGGDDFTVIKLALISTDGESSNVQLDYNAQCGGTVNELGTFEAIDNIRVVPNPEIADITVVIEYTVVDQSFTLLLQGVLDGDFPPTAAESYDLTLWNNRGGGKGKGNRCASGTLSLDGVTLDIVPTP